VSLPSPGSVPPGWYPDPSGQHQWRVWTGSVWSEVTRSYGEKTARAAVITTLPLIRALHRLVRYGVVAFYGGLGLLVSILAHWPSSAHPTTRVLANTLSDAGVALLIMGSVSYALAAKELMDRWTVVALVPGANVIAVSGLVAQRVSTRPALRRMVSEIILLGLFCAQGHSQPWLCVAPTLIALDHVRWTDELIAKLSGNAPVIAEAS